MVFARVDHDDPGLKRAAFGGAMGFREKLDPCCGQANALESCRAKQPGLLSTPFL